MHLNNVGIRKQSLENNLFSLLFELCERVVLLLWIKHLHFGSCSCFYSAKLRKASRACCTGRGTSCQKVTVPALKIVQFCDWIMWHLICKRNISTTEKKESLISHYSFPKVQKSLLLQTYCIVLFVFPFGIWVFRVNSGHIFKLSSKAMRSRLFFFSLLKFLMFSHDSGSWKFKENAKYYEAHSNHEFCQILVSTDLTLS